MKRRWIIRGFFIALLLLSVGGWAWSANHIAWAEYQSRNHVTSFGTDSGTVSVIIGTHASDNQGWLFGTAEIPFRLLPSRHDLQEPHDFFLGFALHCGNSAVGPRVFICHVPYWFFVAMSLAIGCCLWWKTRPKPDSNTAFPVEAKQIVEEKTP